jgi:probable F420-dependent oxidoreductase
MGQVLVGVSVSSSVEPGSGPVTQARQAEDLGFDFVSASDHLHGESPTYEPWTLLSWIGSATSRIGMLTRVLAAPYRNPAVVAKMAETFDRLSAGRLILGLGGGYMDEEFRAFGAGERTPRDKIDGLEEAVRIVRGLWLEPGFSFTGRFARVEEARVEPRPEHPIPIWLGTYGPRALDLTGRLADGWIPTLELAPPEQVGAMRDRVLASAREAGRDPDAITCVYNVDVRVDEVAMPEPGVISGSADSVAEQLRGFLDLGFSAISLLPAGPDRAGQVDRLGREVLPALRF